MDEKDIYNGAIHLLAGVIVRYGSIEPSDIKSCVKWSLETWERAREEMESRDEKMSQ